MRRSLSLSLSLIIENSWLSTLFQKNSVAEIMVVRGCQSVWWIILLFLATEMSVLKSQEDEYAVRPGNGSPQCSPFEHECQQLMGIQPHRHCYARHWQCDGEDDCGNNFDETDCQHFNTSGTLCNATRFDCPNASPIPIGYVCDGEKDCAGGDDEKACQWPVFRKPEREEEVVKPIYSQLQLECAASGHPPPSIVWFHNRSPPTNLPHIESRCFDTERIGGVQISTLTVNTAVESDSGSYTCEAINALGRIISFSYQVRIQQPTTAAPETSEEPTEAEPVENTTYSTT